MVARRIGTSGLQKVERSNKDGRTSIQSGCAWLVEQIDLADVAGETCVKMGPYGVAVWIERYWMWGMAWRAHSSLGGGAGISMIWRMPAISIIASAR